MTALPAAILSTAVIAVSIEWSWLLYLCIPLRPTRNRFSKGIHVFRRLGKPLVGPEIRRVRFRHANHRRIQTSAVAMIPIRSISSLASAIISSSASSRDRPSS